MNNSMYKSISKFETELWELNVREISDNIYLVQIFGSIDEAFCRTAKDALGQLLTEYKNNNDESLIIVFDVKGILDYTISANIDEVSANREKDTNINFIMIDPKSILFRCCPYLKDLIQSAEFYYEDNLKNALKKATNIIYTQAKVESTCTDFCYDNIDKMYDMFIKAQIGDLTSLIFHKWRQPLSTISTLAGYVMLCLEMEEYDRQELIDKLKSIEDNTLGLSDKIQDFNSYCTRESYVTETTLYKIVDSAKNLTGNVFKYNGIDFHIEDRVKKLIKVDVNAIITAVYNIILNGTEALLDNKIENPAITVILDETDDFYNIKINNNGPLLSTEEIEEAFKPFTTFKGGNHMGLGLSLSKNIIEKKFNGAIELSNKQGSVTFKIKLPKTND